MRARTYKRPSKGSSETSLNSRCSLVDGVTSAQENAYTFDHYFGRDDEIERQDNGLAAHRDFAGDGGFLCPSGEDEYY